MSLASAEQGLAKHHLVHFVLGAIVAAILLAIPKLIGVVICVFLAALFLPEVIVPAEFGNKWFDRLAVIVGAIAVGLIFYLAHRL